MVRIIAGTLASGRHGNDRAGRDKNNSCGKGKKCCRTNGTGTGINDDWNRIFMIIR